MNLDGTLFNAFTLHLFTVPFVALIFYTLRPSGAEKSYALNMKYCPFLLPGRWKEKEYFVHWTHRLARLWLVFFTAVYLAGWFLIVRS